MYIISLKNNSILLVFLAVILLSFSFSVVEAKVTQADLEYAKEASLFLQKSSIGDVEAFYENVSEDLIYLMENEKVLSKTNMQHAVNRLNEDVADLEKVLKRLNEYPISNLKLQNLRTNAISFYSQSLNTAVDFYNACKSGNEAEASKSYLKIKQFQNKKLELQRDLLSIANGVKQIDAMAKEEYGSFEEAEKSFSNPKKVVGPCDKPFSGNWSTEWGSMTLIVKGNRLEGSYTHDSGKLTGSVSGRVFDGMWSESPSYAPPNDSGKVKFTLSNDCRSFTGLWGYGNKLDHTNWSGTLLNTIE